MRRIMAGAGGLLLSLTLLAGCTGDDEAPESEGGSSQSSETSATAEPRVPTSARVGQVAGRLGKKQRLKTRRSVTKAVDRWLDAAYVAGDYPRKRFGKAFPGFTPGAARLARRQRGTMSNATVSARVEAVEVKKRKVAIDVLAPRGKPAGATARLVLVMRLTGDVTRTDRVRGRLMLTPARKGWRVFGFDVRRNTKKGGKR